MFNQEIAQVVTSTDATLQNLNVKLDLLKEEYNAVASQPNTYSFFNLDNIYFWFVLAGLLLLAFGLLFLLAEIQNKSDKAKKNKKSAQGGPTKGVEEEPEIDIQAASDIDEEDKEDEIIEETETEPVELETKKEKKSKKASWFKKEKKVKPVAKVEEAEEIIENEEEIEESEPVKSKAKGPIKIKVEKIK